MYSDNIDIKSLGLRHFIRVVLKAIRTAALEAEKPVVLCTYTSYADGKAQAERNLPYHFLAELKNYPRSDEEQGNEAPGPSNQITPVGKRTEIYLLDGLPSLSVPRTFACLREGQTIETLCEQQGHGQHWVFRTMNPNYVRLEVKKMNVFDIGPGCGKRNHLSSQSNGLNPTEMMGDLVICTPTVHGFSLNEKLWGDIHARDISSNLLLKALSAPQMEKALTVLLQKRFSSGDLSAIAEELEVQLTRTFRIANDWRRFCCWTRLMYICNNEMRNFFLTTGRLNDFDEAILDRIHLKLRYDYLDPSARHSVFNQFLGEAKAEFAEEDICKFAEMSLNGRQIKNLVRIAHNVDNADGAKLYASHVRTALTANG
ncbi:hypothetical protein PAAG_03393 [Paracoccidioides lutzii Pb01]|uniref:Uncharacterized protein n=1 Tax=Paracoccidioides lutzii (strain ATCC MYA-826 / Pb01) TaxID=502779 RepID=C1GX19_PARBA|nr:hypothetical protein PAAG_03393 [Paracoccidioides lutzii Pb01]EEH41107.2 hypothetical protein PAAG_03393 [Paracoccidioides lutzii Pb01]